MTGSKYSFRISGNDTKCTERTSAEGSLGGGEVARRDWYTDSLVKGVNDDYANQHKPAERT
jgi:hypothetical protein